mmetsp:Transcript_73289/g.129197  ORF Transcript_73289/g.129197 Transcript_73289/m.129197 type:complete len:227 (+) Transcript_73289:334-1014(+)
MTCCTSGKSSPFPATSVATSTSFVPDLKALMANSRSSWLLPPWMATASTHLSRRYMWMSSTSALFSQNTSTGGGVFCRHSRRYTIFASFFTYSTSWMTSKLAAPARPTFTITCLTSAVSANFCTLRGIVAENRSVCRWYLKKSKIWRTSSSNPMSTMRSASSSTRYLQLSRLMRFFVRKSISRPGVATTAWTPLRTASHCSRMLIPPIMHSVWILGQPGIPERASA